jgi:ABC-type polysaccharide/polyol phosphate transport system ATPase subunit
LPTLRDGAIHADEVWKRFRVDSRPTYFQDQVGRVLDRVRRRPSQGWRWALKEVGLRAEPGESIALIGANGAGKSTLLKILTRVMYPTAGRVEVGGRTGALIEVRAGISPQLSGRENIYLTASLMGLRRRDAARKFDEIVAFAGLEHSVDRLVKFYSMGMQMRLGFGVAAFLEPDVLLVDEVLAVGDASFQHRCLERMRHVLNQGTTLVFVSHDLAAVEATCVRGIWVDGGTIRSTGPVRDVLAAYRAAVEADAEIRPQLDRPVNVIRANASAPEGVKTGGPLEIEIVFRADFACRAWIHVGISEGTATPILLVSPGRETMLEPGETSVRCSIDALPLPHGRYYVWVGASRYTADGEELVAWQPATRFDLYGPGLIAPPLGIVRLAPVHVDSSWELPS